MKNESFYAIVCSLALFTMGIVTWVSGGPERDVQVTGEGNRILTIGGDGESKFDRDSWQLEIIDTESGDVRIVDYNLTLGDCLVQSQVLHDQGFRHVGCMRVGRWN